MAKTPYNSLSSEDILAGHISGLQTDINKIQDILDMKTATKSGHAMTPVVDQDDPALRYRIYEATERNWLDSPVPKIYRNGSLVSSDEFILQAPYGTIVFNEQQSSNDSVTADFTHIIAASTVLESIQNDISTNSTDIGTVQGDITTINSSIETLEGDVNDLGGYDSLSPNSGRPEIMNVFPGRSEDEVGYYNDILQAGNTIDAFPIIIVEEGITINQMSVRVSGSTSAMTMNLAIFSNADAYPHKLLGSTGNFTTVGGQDMYKDLETPVVLQPGIYWVARFQSGGAYLGGYDSNLIEGVIIDIVGTSGYSVNGSGVIIGARTAAGAHDVSTNGMPETFPPNGGGSDYLARGSFGAVRAVR